MRTGNPRRAEEILRQFDDGAGEGAAPNFAVYHFVCGAIDRGFDWAEKSFRNVKLPLSS